jgi:O-methyltransferase domain
MTTNKPICRENRTSRRRRWESPPHQLEELCSTPGSLLLFIPSRRAGTNPGTALKWILHDWSDEACRDILSRVRATMGAGSRLVTIDQHLERNRPSPVSSMIDLLMLVVCEGGRERTPEEVHGLMRDAGLTPGRVRHAGLQMVIEGIAS